MLDIGSMLLWIVLPYMSIAIFIMGLIWQYDLSFLTEKVHHEKHYEVLSGKVAITISIMLFILLIAGIIINRSSAVIQWFIGLLLMNPQPGLMETVSLARQVSVVVFFVVLSVLPFTQFIYYITTPFVELYKIVRLLVWNMVLKLQGKPEFAYKFSDGYRGDRLK